MKADNLFILSHGVEFTPVTSIEEAFRKTFDHGPDDMVITIQNSRTNSKVVSAEFAELLQEFRNPKSLAEVIFAYAEAHQINALDLAEESFSQWLRLKNSGFLIPYNGEDVALSLSPLNPGDKYQDYTIISKRFATQDTEVYQVRDESDNLFALKILKGCDNDQVRNLYQNEVKILHHLDGKVNPALRCHGTDNGNFFIIMDWCFGLTCLTEASKYRNINIRKNIRKLLDISISIVDAFFHLHRQGIFHGDIHPRNIFISPEGTVKIIDYGYSVLDEATHQMQRAGTGFYYEPEFAEAVVNKQARPILTAKAEQYSLAAIIYKVITGTDYIRYSIDEKKIYRQIMTEAPTAFKENDLTLPAELEQVLAKALSKKPADRFPSLQDFADALRHTQALISDSPDFFSVNRENPELQFVEFLIRRFGWNSTLVTKGLSVPPTCSVNYGAAGIAYFFYRLACVRQDPSFAGLAQVWINRALQFEKNSADSFLSSALGLTVDTVGNISIYHSPTGIHLVHALINSAAGNYHALSGTLKSFILAAREPCDKIELALGKAGILTGCSILWRELNMHSGFQIASIENLGDQFMNDIWRHIDAMMPMENQNELNSFGIAHGWAGLLYATLQWCHTAHRELPGSFLTRLNQLLERAVHNKNVIHWPYSILNDAAWKGWCNGSAGHIFLWLLCYQYFNNEKFLRVAEGLANHLSPQPESNNCNLCCGAAGQAYAMLALYKVTGKEIHRNSMVRIKKMLLKNVSSPQLANNGLYKGQVGPGVLFCESENPALGRMPLFE